MIAHRGNQRAMGNEEGIQQEEDWTWLVKQLKMQMDNEKNHSRGALGRRRQSKQETHGFRRKGGRRIGVAH